MRLPPRRKNEIELAIKLIEHRLVHVTGISDPELFVMFPTIREALRELLELRENAKEEDHAES